MECLCCGRFFIDQIGEDKSFIKKIIRKFQFLFLIWYVILNAVLKMRRKTDEK